MLEQTKYKTTVRIGSKTETGEWKQNQTKRNDTVDGDRQSLLQRFVCNQKRTINSKMNERKTH
jgi:hypothetical protein